ncbi:MULTISPECIES: protein-tyrosine kinase [unclassified Dysgonomonas]|uniref:protein-tyrosine kinase n=1 Tax=unclassified Dysgonomonas TaxID=2630389 RepID=UPI0016255FC2|nr:MULTISPECIES: protein-tyrosine kinase [unclassified Dysgonomonas]
MNREIITIENGTVSVPASTEIWMTQHQLADLFQCFVAKINTNVRAILKTGVFDESKVCRTYHYKNGNSVEQYNLEMIIVLSFRIQSRNAEVFRKYIVEKSIRNEETTRLILPLHMMDINNLN